jgi:hypothetical protein
MERAAFHEASHIVCAWRLGGIVTEAAVAYDDATAEWGGWSTPTGLSPEAQVACLVAGGIGESLYVANVYDPHTWLIDEAQTVALLRTDPAGPTTPFTMLFSRTSGETKQLVINRDAFSNDLHRARELTSKHECAIDLSVAIAVRHLNDSSTWASVTEVAKKFLLRPPRMLLWTYTSESPADARMKGWSVDSLIHAAKLPDPHRGD